MIYKFNTNQKEVKYIMKNNIVAFAVAFLIGIATLAGISSVKAMDTQGMMQPTQGMMQNGANTNNGSIMNNGSKMNGSSDLRTGQGGGSGMMPNGAPSTGMGGTFGR